MKKVVVAALMILCLGAGYKIGSRGLKHKAQCFETCASILLLTPDDPKEYLDSLDKVTQCANEE